MYYCNIHTYIHTGLTILDIQAPIQGIQDIQDIQIRLQPISPTPTGLGFRGVLG